MNRESCIVSHESWIMYLASLFSAVLAMKTKETAFTLPLIIVLHELMFFSDSRFTIHDSRFKKRVLFLIPFLLTMLIIPLTLLGTNKPIADVVTNMIGAINKSKAMSTCDYLLTQFRVIVTYIRLLVLPINQNFDYDYPVYNSFFEPQIVLSFLFLLSIFGLGVYLFYRSRFTMHDTPSFNSPLIKGGHRGVSRITHHALRLIAFGVLWFFITLSFESSIIPISPALLFMSPVKANIDVIFEHRVYLPSIGLIVAFSTALFHVLQRSDSTTVRQCDSVTELSRDSSHSPIHPFTYSPIPIIALIVVLTIAAYQRNIVWKDEVSLWEDAASKSSKKDRVHNNLGRAYGDEGRFDEAIKQFKTAIGLNPYFARAHNCLGAAYQAKGLIDSAINHYQIAIKLKPNDPDPRYNLGRIYFDRGNMDVARREFKEVLRINPSYYEAQRFLELTYFPDKKNK
ncbi:MAG: tetratricopeptide repeat protein [Nitrospirae bacterium]|nr:tetratricopeptide repeat protein [Nitrospirota bacterium]